MPNSDKTVIDIEAFFLRKVGAMEPNEPSDFIRQSIEKVDYGIDFRPAETIRKFEAVGLIFWDPSFGYLVRTADRIAITEKMMVDSYTATRQTSGSSVSETFGRQRCFPMYTIIALVANLLSKQINGTPPGTLLIMGNMNAFYFFDETTRTERFVTTRRRKSGRWEASIKEVDECVFPEGTMVHMLYQGDI